MKTPVDALLPTLKNWNLKDLRELRAVVNGLIEAQEAPTKKTKASKPAGKHNTNTVSKAGSSPKTSRGHIETKYIPRGNKRHGPYLYLRYWEDGKLKSKYMGKADEH